MTDPVQAASTVSALAPAATGRRFVIVHLVELKCLACGRDIGMLQARSWPSAGPVLFRAADTHSVVALADWSRLRCATCGGNVYADYEDTTRVYPALTREQLDVPRRGRPPNWLVAQRNAQLEVPEE